MIRVLAFTALILLSACDGPTPITDKQINDWVARSAKRCGDGYIIIERNFCVPYKEPRQ